MCRPSVEMKEQNQDNGEAKMCKNQQCRNALPRPQFAAAMFRHTMACAAHTTACNPATNPAAFQQSGHAEEH